jgi:hypothetical protein
LVHRHFLKPRNVSEDAGRTQKNSIINIMDKYQLTVPHEFEAFHLGIHLTIMHIQDESEPIFTTTETKDATIYTIPFDEEDQMYAFDKEIRNGMPFLFKS